MTITKKTKKHTEQLNREIEIAVSKFSQRFMSNSKWVRLIDKLVENADKILEIELKQVHKDQLRKLYIYKDMTFGFDYWQGGFEDSPWLTFKEIEYLLFPKIIDKDKYIEQDLFYIEELIKSVGEFYLDMNENRLKLICYK